VVADTVRVGSVYELAGFLDDVHQERHGQQFCGARVLGGREQLDRLLAQGVRNIILGFGDNAARMALGRELVERGFVLGQAIHPRATVAQDVRIGVGTVVVAGAVVNPNTVLGENVIVNTCASVDHDCIVEDGVHVAPGARLAGNVRIGSETWIGLGALVLQDRTVGARTLVGAGAVVTRDLPDDVVAYGAPARVIRHRSQEIHG
jgi:acetyltransferase EpsM